MLVAFWGGEYIQWFIIFTHKHVHVRKEGLKNPSDTFNGTYFNWYMYLILYTYYVLVR